MDLLLDRQHDEQSERLYPEDFKEDDTYNDEEDMKLPPEEYLKNKMERRVKSLEF
jgi:hypothetical protein